MRTVDSRLFARFMVTYVSETPLQALAGVVKASMVVSLRMRLTGLCITLALAS